MPHFTAEFPLTAAPARKNMLALSCFFPERSHRMVGNDAREAQPAVTQDAPEKLSGAAGPAHLVCGTDLCRHADDIFCVFCFVLARTLPAHRGCKCPVGCCWPTEQPGQMRCTARDDDHSKLPQPCSPTSHVPAGGTGLPTESPGTPLGPCWEPLSPHAGPTGLRSTG